MISHSRMQPDLTKPALTGPEHVRVLELNCFKRKVQRLLRSPSRELELFRHQGRATPIRTLSKP